MKSKTTDEIKLAVKEVFGLKSKRDGLVNEIKTIDERLLTQYGIAASSFETREQRSWPELTVETVKAFITSKGTAGVKAGELRDHFGPSFNGWKGKSENTKPFTITKDGIKMIWTVK